MGLREKLNGLDRRYAWSFFGFMLAIFFGGFTVYSEFYKDRSPDLKYELVTNASVLDVREDLPHLKVEYDGTDITKTQQSLSVLVFRVVNRGAGDILTTHYDERFPVGFRIKSGEIIRTEVLGATSNYLKNAVALTSSGPQEYKFAPVILDSGESYTVKLLVLHGAVASPTIAPEGKIAGDPRIEIEDISVVQAATGFWATTFGGGLWTQIVRLVSYFIGLVLLGLGIGIPIALFASFVGKSSRKRKVAGFKKVAKVDLTRDDDFIFDGYISTNEMFLRRLLSLTTDENLSMYFLGQEAHAGNGDSGLEAGVEISLLQHDELTREHYEYPPRAIKKGMIENNFVTEVDGEWKVSSERKKTLNAFMEYLEYIGSF